MKIKIATTTDTGKVRANNEDALIVCPDLSQQNWSQDKVSSYVPLSQYGSVLVVADGMGGANAGDVASRIAIDTIKDSFTIENVERILAGDKIYEFLSETIEKADDAINMRICEDPDTYGMGTTIVVCWIINGVAHIAWCGDSRCYVYNPFSGMVQLTKDHSLVQEMVDRGEITEVEAFAHPDNNIITRGLGDVNSQSTPDIVSHPLKPNDMILLCSDGLCGFITNKEIENVLSENSKDITKCSDLLLKLALDAGGYDNICIVLASIICDDSTALCVPTTLQKILIRMKRLFKF